MSVQLRRPTSMLFTIKQKIIGGGEQLSGDHLRKKGLVEGYVSHLEHCIEGIKVWEDCLDKIDFASRFYQNNINAEQVQISVGTRNLHGNNCDGEILKNLAKAKSQIKEKIDLIKKLKKRHHELENVLLVKNRALRKYEDHLAHGKDPTKQKHELDAASVNFHKIFCEIDGTYEFLIKESDGNPIGLAKAEMDYLGYCQALFFEHGSQQCHGRPYVDFGQLYVDFTCRKANFIADRQYSILSDSSELLGVKKLSGSSTNAFMETQSAVPPPPPPPPPPPSPSLQSVSSPTLKTSTSSFTNSPPLRTSKTSFMNNNSTITNQKKNPFEIPHVKSTNQPQPPSDTQDFGDIPTAEVIIPEKPEIKNIETKPHIPKELETKLESAFEVGECNGYTAYIDGDTGEDFWVNKSTYEIVNTKPEE